MLQAYDGYWNNDGIFPIGAPQKIVGYRKVVITVLEEREESTKEKALSIEEQKAFWAEFERLSEESAHEELHHKNFERAKTNRELLIFSEER
ncbi:MAG: hypothetical protein FWH05_02155 [Oscillospiraceae bacterium]|nr:hypothetical protein [Oscillospiraceae bacterium]